ncbi:MAG TPA: xanthine dehydrogenase family protein molybdopterin-binding subunit [Usitatibacter sp.]|nr:xanthine dehydrogenase family protein molybdopterin-binding subunit [Usitatibacter sp.]
MDAAKHQQAGAEIRSDLLEKVTGKATYASDVKIPGMLHGRVLRSPLPHARIRSIDTSAALAMPGVVAVLTGADLEGANTHWGLYLRDRPLIAIDRVRYVGDPVAAVAAVDEFTAEEALDAILVDYEQLPHVTDAEEAMRPDAPVVHERMDKLQDFYFRGSANAKEGSNVFQHYVYGEGDVDAAFAAAHRVFEDRFTFPMVFHYAMEPHVVVADYRDDGITCWSGSQSPHTVQKVLSQLFEMPMARIRIVVPYVGGGFGGKSSVKIDPLVVALSRKARAPVRVCLGISESMLTARRLSAAIELKTAVAADGELLGKSVRVVMNGGAYADTGAAVAIKAAIRAIGPYRIPNLKLESFAVYTNTVPGAAFRSIGGPPAVWATESQMDVIAEALGIDPIELRLKNMVRKGELVKADLRPIDVDMPGMLRLALETLDAMPGATGKARGVAAAASDPANIPIANAIVRLKVDGSVLVMTASIEMGQGVHGVLRSVAAKALAQPLEVVRIATPDTESAPYDWATGASRSTVIMGLAVEEACHDIARQARELAAGIIGGTPDQYTLVENGLEGPTGFTPMRKLFVSAFGMDSGELIGVGRMSPFARGGSLAKSPLFWETAVGVGEAEVDVETGEVRLARYVSAADVGKVLNRRSAEGQDEGAAIQALGHTLFEELVYEDGQPLNATMIDYHVPSMEETPRGFHTVLIESGDGPGPQGARGMGEGAILPLAPAVANAIANGYGVRIRELPLTPERVWRALRK